MELINSCHPLITAGAAGRQNYCAVRRAFQILSTTLLSLLLPLSFLLLARLSKAHYLFSVSDDYRLPEPTPFICSLFLHAQTPTVLHLLVSIITVPSLIHALTGKITIFVSQSGRPLARSRLVGAWIFLILVQVCVGLGVEGSIVSGIDGSGFGQGNSFLGRTMFFFGLHDAMMFWGATVVKLVVDDTIFSGAWRKESGGVVEKVAVGVSYGGFWWWRLREEVEALVVVPELKRELAMGIGAADFMGWWLYYLTVTTGMVRLVKGLGLTVVILTRRRVTIIIEEEDESGRADDEKV